MGMDEIAKLVGPIIKAILEFIWDRFEKRQTSKNQPPPSPLMPQDADLTTSVNQSQGIPHQQISPGVKTFQEMVQRGEYKAASNQADDERRKLVASLASTDSDRQLEIDDFDVWHSRVLIYTGETKEGIDKLKEIINRLKAFETTNIFRKNMILGRAYNDIGYAFWMNLGHYEMALNAFIEAIQYYSTVQKTQGDPLATAYDNLGRVYAQLGYRVRAESLIEYGRNIRATLRDWRNDRYSLSLISYAITQLAFGDPYYASELSKEVLDLLQENDNLRQVGLARITLGQSYRYIGTLWISRRSEDLVERDFSDSLKYLNDALKTFGESNGEAKIVEPIRLSQIYNEIGCTYREILRLKTDSGLGGDAARIANLSEKNLRAGLAEAIEKDYDVLIVDSYEDLAQLYKLFDQIGAPVPKNEKAWLEKAKEQLTKAERKIQKSSADYLFKPHRNAKRVDSKDCVEDFWQLLGKIYALRGHIEFDYAMSIGQFYGKNSRKALSKAVENYILAVAYFGRFTGIYKWEKSPKIAVVQDEIVEKKDHTEKDEEATRARGGIPILTNQRVFMEQIISRLSKLEDIDTINGICTVMLPEVKKEYCIKDDRVDDFFNEIIGLVLQTKPPSSQKQV